MTLPVRWSAPAADDLEEIVAFIRRDGDERARRVAREIHKKAESLAVFPNRGRIGREPGTRELTISPLPFLIVYRVLPKAVEVARIIHGARVWPPGTTR